MAAISPPNTTIKYIEALIADFFWGRDQDKRKYHWASLETLSLPCTEGGVGLRRLNDICTSLQYKQWWTFRTKDTLWSQFLKSKYCQRAHPVAKKVDTGDSLMWKYMMKNKITVEDHIGWKINSGSCSFWWDDWLGVGALANYTTYVSSLNNATIAHFLANGEWNEREIRQQGVTDTAVWKHTESGKFTCSSASEICRKKKDTTVIHSQIWHRHIPFKMSFLLWRAIRHKLPTNEKLAIFGVEPWRGITGKNEAHNTILQTLPIVICWNLWKNRCSSKYGGKKSSILRFKYLVLKDMLLILNSVFPYLDWPVIWPEVVDCAEKCQQDIRITLIMWKTPPPSRYKLNMDGSALHNPGKIGGGGILRDDHGVIIFAFAIPLGEGTNNQAEVSNSPWRIHRKANSTADLLAKHSHKHDIVQHYYIAQQLPQAVKGSYLLEKMGVQSVRRKKLKRLRQPP
ncbi:hypothetical protein KY285_030275 [Solanum tuberosum]|nr:hypothetical protein KY285_030275 [Solanum tuberosum]